MTTRLTELSILFLSLVKWFFLAGVVGLLVGLSSTLFLISLQGSLVFTQSFPYAFLLLPVGLALSAIMTTKLAPGAQGYGTEQVIRAIHQEGGKINPRVIPVKFIAAIATIASGGSAGNVGPCALIGGGLCSALGQLIRLEDVDRIRLVVCGISAGFAAVFGTPVAGALFAIEVLWVGRLSYGALFPSLVSAFVGYQVASTLGIAYLSPASPSIPPLSVPFFLSVGLAGVTFGVAAFLFVEILGIGKRLSNLTKTSAVLTGLIGGVVLIAITLLFSDDYLGLGWTTVSQTLRGERSLVRLYAQGRDDQCDVELRRQWGHSSSSLFLWGCPGVGLGQWLGNGSRHLCRAGTRQRVGRCHQYSHRRHCPGHGIVRPRHCAVRSHELCHELPAHGSSERHPHATAARIQIADFFARVSTGNRGCHVEHQIPTHDLHENFLRQTVFP